jgi:hypothetical protein
MYFYDIPALLGFRGMFLENTAQPPPLSSRLTVGLHQILKFILYVGFFFPFFKTL